MKKIRFLVVFSVFAFISCKKTPEIVSASGVRALLFVQHHGVPIANARIFLKKGTLVFPGTDTTLYDERFVTDANGKFTLSGLPNGQYAYTFYAKGVDPGWDSTHCTQVWGYQFLISDTHTGEMKDYNVSVPVSE